MTKAYNKYKKKKTYTAPKTKTIILAEANNWLRVIKNQIKRITSRKGIFNYYFNMDYY